MENGKLCTYFDSMVFLLKLFQFIEKFTSMSNCKPERLSEVFNIGTFSFYAEIIHGIYFSSKILLVILI